MGHPDQGSPEAKVVTAVSGQSSRRKREETRGPGPGKLISELSAPALVIDSTHNIVAVNGAFERMGSDLQPILGACLTDLLPQDRDRESVDAILDQVIEGGASESFKTVLEFSGAPVEARMAFFAVTVGGDNHAICLVEDIAEAERIELILRQQTELCRANAKVEREIEARLRAAVAQRESDDRYRKLFNESQDAVYVSTLDGQVIDANQSFLDLFGYTREEMRGMDIRRIYTNPEDRKRFKAEIGRDGSVREYEILFQRKDGTQIPCLVTSTIRTDERGAPAGYQGVIRDITRRREFEKALTSRLRYEKGLADFIKVLLAGHETSLKNSLYELLNAAAVTRVALFLNESTPEGPLCMSLVHEVWAIEMDRAQCRSCPDLLPYNSGLQRWQDNLSTGIPVKGPVKSFPATERKILETEGVISILALPVFVDGDWFGFIRLDDHRTPRVWGPEDVRLLRTAAEITGGYLSRQRIERALRESESEYRELVQSANSIILRMGVDGAISFMNRFGEEYFGYPEHEIVGRNVVGTIVPSRDSAGRNLAAMILDIGRNPEKYRDNENENIRRDGKSVWVRWTNRGIKDETGRIREVLCVGTDITDRKLAEESLQRAFDQLEERVAERTADLVRANQLLRKEIAERLQAEKALIGSESKYRGLFEQSRDPIVIVTLDGRFVDANRAASDLFGYSREVLMSINGRELWAFPEQRKKWASHLAKEGFAKDYPWKARTKKGAILDCLMTSTARKSEEGELLYQTIIRDVTEEKRAAEALQLAHDELEIRVEERTSELVLANERLTQEIQERRAAEQRLQEALAMASRLRAEADAANQAKSEFLANMSHELRTPLNAVIGFSEILYDRLVGDLNDEQSEYIHHIVQSGKHLLTLINDILDLARVEAGKTEIVKATLPLMSFLRSARDLIEERAAVKSIAVELEIPEELHDLEIKADETKLRQIMLNLLSNAVKFTPPEGRVTVQAAKLSHVIEISVSDSGIGLRTEDQEKIFDVFHQADSTYARKQEGAGLGLALTKKMVELHGGQIRVESQGEWQGARFTFSLPIS